MTPAPVDKTGHSPDNCSGGGEAHEAHLALNDECPWGPKEPVPEGDQ